MNETTPDIKTIDEAVMFVIDTADEQARQLVAALGVAEKALEDISQMDWKNAATNCTAYEASRVARAALTAVREAIK